MVRRSADLSHWENVPFGWKKRAIPCVERLVTSIMEKLVLEGNMLYEDSSTLDETPKEQQLAKTAGPARLQMFWGKGLINRHRRYDLCRRSTRSTAPPLVSVLTEDVA